MTNTSSGWPIVVLFVVVLGVGVWFALQMRRMEQDEAARKRDEQDRRFAESRRFM